MTPIVVTVGPLAAAAANNIATTQTPAGAGNLTLDGALVIGGVAVMDNPRRVRITAVSDESGKTLTIYGTNWAGDSISETMTGPVGTTGDSVLSYKTVTRIAVSAAFTGAVTAGTNGVADSPWVRLDSWALSQTAIQITVSGTANFTMQQTLDDPNSYANPVTPANMTWVNSNDTGVVGATTTKQTNYAYPPVFARILLNSSTSPGFVTATFSQSGVVGR